MHPRWLLLNKSDKEIGKNSPDSIFGATLISVQFPANIRIYIRQASIALLVTTAVY